MSDIDDVVNDEDASTLQNISSLALLLLIPGVLAKGSLFPNGSTGVIEAGRLSSRTGIGNTNSWRMDQRRPPMRSRKLLLNLRRDRNRYLRLRQLMCW